jgi:hypothetical protein
MQTDIFSNNIKQHGFIYRLYNKITASCLQGFLAIIYS